MFLIGLMIIFCISAVGLIYKLNRGLAELYMDMP